MKDAVEDLSGASWEDNLRKEIDSDVKIGKIVLGL